MERVKLHVRRSFPEQWFKQWKWLHYNNVRDVVYCHCCVSAINSGKMQLKGNAHDSTFFLVSLTEPITELICLEDFKITFTLPGSKLRQASFC